MQKILFISWTTLVVCQLICAIYQHTTHRSRSVLTCNGNLELQRFVRLTAVISLMAYFVSSVYLIINGEKLGLALTIGKYVAHILAACLSIIVAEIIALFLLALKIGLTCIIEWIWYDNKSDSDKWLDADD